VEAATQSLRAAQKLEAGNLHLGPAAAAIRAARDVARLDDRSSGHLDRLET
jgi:hypothetical protein